MSDPKCITIAVEETRTPPLIVEPHTLYVPFGDDVLITWQVTTPGYTLMSIDFGANALYTASPDAVAGVWSAQGLNDRTGSFHYTIHVKSEDGRDLYHDPVVENEAPPPGGAPALTNRLARPQA